VLSSLGYLSVAHGVEEIERVTEEEGGRGGGLGEGACMCCLSNQVNKDGLPSGSRAGGGIEDCWTEVLVKPDFVGAVALGLPGAFLVRRVPELSQFCQEIRLDV
jgi:hypothetical protein